MSCLDSHGRMVLGASFTRGIFKLETQLFGSSRKNPLSIQYLQRTQYLCLFQHRAMWRKKRRNRRRASPYGGSTFSEDCFEVKIGRLQEATTAGHNISQSFTHFGQSNRIWCSSIDDSWHQVNRGCLGDVQQKDSITMENKLIWEGSATALGMYKDIHREA